MRFLHKNEDNSKRIYYESPVKEEIKQIEKLGIKVFSADEYYELLTYYLPGENKLFLSQRKAVLNN